MPAGRKKDPEEKTQRQPQPGLQDRSKSSNVRHVADHAGPASDYTATPVAAAPKHHQRDNTLGAYTMISRDRRRQQKKSYYYYK